ncbi:hypothetical protein [Streptacidiphilus sp. P02-A3a]|uniref:hypothetical protein n=1 Tax=Streptacidiphilus sp. P02-A3a TaxID=2704468 RepID=UPI0015FA5BC4|nr:hypothetical protein [Streptacidiphilus sp. P02-A3a]QMU67167.1 hypothetical protein GXP74_02020 [Streptacidiphilus sp. P02-A3a]
MASDRGRQRTSLAKYVGGVLEAVEEFVTDTRECVEGFLENSDSVQRSALRTARRALRPGSEPEPDELAALRAEVAALAARLSRYEAAPADVPEPA